MEMEQIGSLLEMTSSTGAAEVKPTIWPGTKKSRDAKTQISPEQRTRVEAVYAKIRPHLSSTLTFFNLSDQHVVAVTVADGVVVRYNIADSVFSKSTSEDSPGTSLIFRITALKDSERIEIPTNRLKFYDADKLPLVETEQKHPLLRKIDFTEDLLPELTEALRRDIHDFLCAILSISDAVA